MRALTSSQLNTKDLNIIITIIATFYIFEYCFTNEMLRFGLRHLLSLRLKYSRKWILQGCTLTYNDSYIIKVDFQQQMINYNYKQDYIRIDFECNNIVATYRSTCNNKFIEMGIISGRIVANSTYKVDINLLKQELSKINRDTLYGIFDIINIILRIR